MVHHVITALIMMKISNTQSISMRNENDALFLGEYVKHNIENTMIKELL